MFISKYVKKIEFDENSLVLHNMYNGSIYLITKDDYEDILNGDFGNKNCKVLIEENYLVEEENQPIQIRDNNFIAITIEVSNECNLNCVYCYENDKNTRGKMTLEVQESILTYISNVMNVSSSSVGIRFIGGEPLLEKQKVIFFINKINELANKNNIKVNYVIDTNGTIPFNDLYAQYENLKIAVSLTTREDHNQMRISNSFDSFERIVKNLKTLKYKESNTVEIRYNTNEKNIKDFRKFVEFVRRELPICSAIKPMYTDEYSHHSFRNKLELDEFKKWNASDAIDILIENEFPVFHSVGGSLTICESYQKYSCKIYLDGIVTICDSMFHDAGNINICSVCNSPEALEIAFEKYRSFNPLNDADCADCTSIALCQGKLFCKNNPCDYNKRINIEFFIKKYVEYCKMDKWNYFPMM